MKALVLNIFIFFLFSLSADGAHKAVKAPMSIAGGKFTPLYGFGKKEKREYKIEPFYLDATPVTRREFDSFLKKNPQWSKGKINPLYADATYLTDFTSSRNKAHFPITSVSWFAADAYCRSSGGRLPTTLEWEFFAASVGGVDTPNFQELRGLYGLIWEWTSDFNSVFVSGDNRQDGDKSTAAVCGVGATDASNRSDYAAFMRYAMRSSLEARFSQKNLGFRCAYDRKGEIK